MPEYSTDRISYPEHHAVTEATRAHFVEYGARLKALVAFGDLVQTAQSFDLYVLEVVSGWTGPRRIELHSSAEVPLRGKLVMFFVSPSEFERASEKPLPGLDISAKELLRLVVRGYAVLHSLPAGYARDVLRRVEEESLLGTPGSTC